MLAFEHLKRHERTMTKPSKKRPPQKRQDRRKSKPPESSKAPAESRQTRMGAPRNNRNHMRHGLSASKLPSGCQYLENRLNAFRRQLEDLCIQAKGEISMIDAANIQTAMKWERHAGLCERWLRLEGNNLKPADKINFSREIAKASTERDKALKALELDRDAKRDALTILYQDDSK